MISLEELRKVKELRRTTLYYEEKEYLQYIFLYAISRYTDDFIFKGGTCLRICYGLNRASEDLDFSTTLIPSKVQENVQKSLVDFDLLNIKHKQYATKEYQGNIRIEARFEGPLYNGSLSSTNTLKLDFNKRKVHHPLAKVIPKLFSDIPPFTIMILEEKEILIEKIRALANRGESRDLYDVWILLQKGTEIDQPLLRKKLREEQADLSKIRFPGAEEYVQDLKNLISFVPPYAQVRAEVEKKMKELQK